MSQSHRLPRSPRACATHLAHASAAAGSAVFLAATLLLVTACSESTAPVSAARPIASASSGLIRVAPSGVATAPGTAREPMTLEQAVAVCLEQGWLRRHAERVIARLGAARTRSVKLALAAGCRFVTPPAGLFGWVDTGVDTERLATDMLDDGWLLAPGTVFHARRRPSTLMRINFATTQEPRFWAAFEKARAT